MFFIWGIIPLSLILYAYNVFLLVMESFDYADYSETLRKFVDLMPKLYSQVEGMDVDDLVVMKKYFDYQRIINQRMSKQINAILFKKSSTEFIKGKK